MYIDFSKWPANLIEQNYDRIVFYFRAYHSNENLEVFSLPWQ